MKITKHGQVIVRAGQCAVENFVVEREESDNPSVSDEQLMLHTAVSWALGRLTFEWERAKNEAIARTIKEQQREN